MPFYRNILKQSWGLTWRNKYLWWFGIFAALLGNSELEILFNNLDGESGQTAFPAWERIFSTGLFSEKTYGNIGNLFKYDTLNMIIFLVIALLILALFILLVWLVMVSQAAIVSAAAKKPGRGSLGEGLKTGILNFWPVLFLNVLVKVVVYALLVVISLPVIFSPGGLSAKVFYILALIISVPLAMILSFIMKYAIAYTVVSGSRIGQALKQSWRLFKDNWLVSFEMAVLLLFINLLAALTVLLAVLALAVPFLFLGLIFYYALAAAGSWLIAVLALICFLAIAITFGAVLSVFQIASWTSLFLELNKKRGESKLVRIVNNLVKAG